MVKEMLLTTYRTRGTVCGAEYTGFAAMPLQQGHGMEALNFQCHSSIINLGVMLKGPSGAVTAPPPKRTSPVIEKNHGTRNVSTVRTSWAKNSNDSNVTHCWAYAIKDSGRHVQVFPF